MICVKCQSWCARPLISNWALAKKRCCLVLVKTSLLYVPKDAGSACAHHQYFSSFRVRGYQIIIKNQLNISENKHQSTNPTLAGNVVNPLLTVRRELVRTEDLHTCGMIELN